MADAVDDDTVPLSEPAAGAPLPVGAKLGRFLVIGTLGAGGMGVVVSAYDPALGRKVAIKLLRDDAWGGAGERQARLAREAQAMAQLQHPNVVAVYEVGAVGNNLFVVMEQVDGHTLKSWLQAEPRDWRAVRAMFVAAGRGLEAAHRAGLVHRDVKPSNVLVGQDGRARITDFGLVNVSAPSVDSPDTSRTGVVGTPGYMAPEQLGDAPHTVDARADQFSFCVALYEALYGARPFKGDSHAELRAAMATTPSLPARANVPAWLGAIVLRGLERDPERRWPDMTALLHELERDPDLERRRRLVLVPIATLLLLVGVLLWRADRARRNQCDASAQLAGVWDDAVRAHVSGAFDASGAALAGEAFSRVSVAVDAYLGGWTKMSEEACRATRIEGRQSDTLYDLRVRCLDARKQQVAALLQQWSSGMNHEAVAKTPDAVAELPPLDACADAAALTAVAPLPADKRARADIAAVRAELDRARAVDAAADAKGALALARHAADAAARIDWPEIQAEAQLELGRLIQSSGDTSGVENLHEAARLAALAHDDELVARAYVEVASAGLMRTRELYSSGQAMGEAAEIMIARAGNSPILRGRLLTARAGWLSHQEKYDQAIKMLLQARELLAVEDPLHPDNVRVLNWLIDFNMERRTLEEAEQWGNRALALERRGWGEQSPLLADTLLDVANVYAQGGDVKRARDLYQQSLTLDQQRYGETAPRLSTNLANLCIADEYLGHLRAALAECERAADLERPSRATGEVGRLRHDQARLRFRLGESDAEAFTRRALADCGSEKINQGTWAGLLVELAPMLAARHDFDGAAQAIERALAIWPQAPYAYLARAELARVGGRCAAARADYRTAAATFAKDGPESVDLALAHSGEGRCALDQGHAAEAVALLTSALAVFDKFGLEPYRAGAARFTRARAEAALGQHERARVDAERAERELATAEDAAAKDELAALRRWRK